MTKFGIQISRVLNAQYVLRIEHPHLLLQMIYDDDDVILAANDLR